MAKFKALSREYFTLEELCNEWDYTKSDIDHCIVAKGLRRAVACSLKVRGVSLEEEPKALEICNKYQYHLKRDSGLAGIRRVRGEVYLSPEAEEEESEKDPAIKAYKALHDKTVLLCNYLYLDNDTASGNKCTQVYDLEGNSYAVYNVQDSFPEQCYLPFERADLVITREEKERFESDHLEKKPSQKTINAQNDVIRALSKALIGDLTGKSHKDAAIIIGALSKQGIESPVEERTLANYLSA